MMAMACSNKFEFSTKDLAAPFFDRFYLLNLETRICTDYDVKTGGAFAAFSYDEHIAALARNMHNADRCRFLSDAELPHIQSVLNENAIYCMYYYKQDVDFRRTGFRLNVRYADETKTCLLFARQPEPECCMWKIGEIAALRRDSERFHFLANHSCEEFIEIDPATSDCEIYQKNSNLPQKTTFPKLIAWRAEYMIVPEERDRYLREFELESFIRKLRLRGNFYSTTYTIQSDGTHRSILLVNALFRKTGKSPLEYIFTYSQDITLLKEQEEKNKQLIDISEQLFHLSQTESLTNLLNRAAGERSIEKSLQDSLSPFPGVLLIIDIDRFKAINDNYGHTAGDTVLRFVAQTIRDSFRSDDILCRWGGDEFLIFIHETVLRKNIESRIEQLRMRLRFYEQNGTPLPIHISVGGIIAKTGDRLPDLFKRSDQALYRVKEHGRNGFLILE